MSDSSVRQHSHCIAPYMYIDGHATENYDASTLKVYASIRITQILGNLTHAQTDCTRPPPQKMAWVRGYTHIWPCDRAIINCAACPGAPAGRAAARNVSRGARRPRTTLAINKTARRNERCTYVRTYGYNNYSWN